MDLELLDRVYVVTGGARGLGRATAETLVAEGAKVVLSGRNAETLEEAVAALGDSAIFVVADNADPEAAPRVVGAAVERWGRVDGALISVGGPPTGTISATHDADWTRSFESVFLGAVRVARTVAGAMEGPGALAFVLSTSVRAPLPGMAISNGLRPGLAMVAKQLADELGPRGIRVVGLMPGRVGTERVAELDALSGDAEAAKAAMVATIPLRRYGEPGEFGDLAAFMLSPRAGYVTGAMVPVDGGLTRAL